jgi:hypothetical protein
MLKFAGRARAEQCRACRFIVLAGIGEPAVADPPNFAPCFKS